jgi:hypothetical protein
MGLFKQVEGETVILVQNGTYKQLDLYTRDGWFYAKNGGGFVRLYADGSTSVTKCRLDMLTATGTLFADKFGRLCDSSVAGATVVSDDKLPLLIGNMP